MSTGVQKGRNNQRESTKNVSAIIFPPGLCESIDFCDQEVMIAGPSRPKSPRIDNSDLKSLRASEKKGLLIESQRELLNMLKPKTKGGGN